MFIIDVKSQIDLGNTSLSAWIVEHPFLQPKISNAIMRQLILVQNLALDIFMNFIKPWLL